MQSTEDVFDEVVWCELCGLVRLRGYDFRYLDYCPKKNRKTDEVVSREACHEAKILLIGSDAPDEVKAQRTLLLMMGGDKWR